VVSQAAEPVLLLDRATRAKIRAALLEYRGQAWAPQGLDRRWWAEFARGKIETVPVSRWRTVYVWFPQVRIVL
jgi:hypothetical protein